MTTCATGDKLGEKWAEVAFTGTKAETRRYNAMEKHQWSCPICLKHRLSILGSWYGSEVPRKEMKSRLRELLRESVAERKR